MERRRRVDVCVAKVGGPVLIEGRACSAGVVLTKEASVGVVECGAREKCAVVASGLGKWPRRPFDVDNVEKIMLDTVNVALAEHSGAEGIEVLRMEKKMDTTMA